MFEYAAGGRLGRALLIIHTAQLVQFVARKDGRGRVKQCVGDSH